MKKVSPLGLSALASVIVSFALSAMILSCQTGAKNRTPPFVSKARTKPPEGYTQPSAVLLTTMGESFEAYFGPDQKSIYYLSQNRPEHIHSQVYVMNLESGVERRLTFHDGEDSCPFPMPDGQSFVYSSSTDEIKEGDDLFQAALTGSSPTEEGNAQPITTLDQVKKLKGEHPPMELYSSRLNGSRIERLTSSPGYDSEVTVHPSGKRLVFSSRRTGDIELFTIELGTKGLKRLTNETGADGGAVFDKRGSHLAWRHISADQTEAQIYISDADGKNAKPLTTKRAFHLAPFWHPSGEWVVFASNRDEVEGFEIYVADRKGLCLKRITWDGVTNMNPSFNSDGDKILFTSNRSGRLQVYQMDFKPTAACQPELP